MTHLPALSIIIPLLAAPSCVILRQALLVRIFSILVTLCAFGLSIALTQQVLATGPIAYHVGGWEPPWGIELRADALTCLLLLLVSGIASVVLTIGIGPGSHRVPEGREALFYAMFLLCMTGLIGMTMTADAFNAFVFLEISSLSTYTLIALGKTRRALTAAMNYLVLGTLGGTFYMLGVGFLYQITGTLNMADLARLLPPLVDSRTFIVGVAFILVGLGLKLAVFPLHQWLPNAYSFAPSSVSAFLSGTATKVSFYLMVRFVFTVLGATVMFQQLGLKYVLLPLSLLAMFVGSAAAIFQSDFKRLLAYSSVAQLGYMTLAISLGTEQGLFAGLLHLVNHGVMKAGLFLVAAAFVAKVGSSRIQDMAGLGKSMPLTCAAMVVGGLALIGVPGTSGFISKWYLVLAAIETGDVYLAFVILLSSLLAVAYVWKLIEVCYFREPPPGRTAAKDEPPSIVIPAWTLMMVTLVFGIFSDIPGDLARRAAADVTAAGAAALVPSEGEFDEHPPLRVGAHPSGEHAAPTEAATEDGSH